MAQPPSKRVNMTHFPSSLAFLLAFSALVLADDKPKGPLLKLVREAKCEKVFPSPGPFDASGLTLAKGELYLVFDTRKAIGVVSPDLKSGRLSEAPAGISDYEGISYDSERGCFYVVVEALRTPQGYKGGLIELDASLKPKAQWILDPPIGGPSKGFEGVLALRRAGREYVLVMLESNHGAAKADPKADDLGNGRLRVYERKEAEGAVTWALVTTIHLPSEAKFEDYAGLSLRGRRLAVVSQSTRRLWIGTLDPKRWAIEGKGQVYRFPKTGGRYGNLEGVAWLSDEQLAFVSDGARGKAKNLAKAESVHVFELPE